MPKNKRSCNGSYALTCFRILVIGVFLASVFVQVQAQGQKGDILVGAELVEGFDMGINTSGGKTDWLSKELEYLKAAFPANQKWAAVFITVGDPTEPPRPFLDFSAYKTLSIQMRGAVGGEKIEVGLKMNTQPDNGRETKIAYSLTPNWVSYEIPLHRFRGTDLTHLYVVTELVYNGQTPQVVYFKDIRFTK